MGALADLILIIHFLWVLSVLLPIPLIWIGGRKDWRWVRNFGFRITHLTMIGIVVLESVLGLVCPLTLWEDMLRGRPELALGARSSFVEYWLSRILFYEFPSWVFTTAYLCVGALILLELWRIPPNRKHKNGLSRML